MAITSLARPFLYKNWLVGNSPSADFELISTVELSSSTAQVDFNLSGITGFKHLQIRVSAVPVADKVMQLRFNSDAGTNYSYHGVESGGVSLGPFNGTTQNYAYLGYVAAGSTLPAVTIIDIADAFGSKNKTIKSYFGSMQSSGSRIQLISSGWYSTAAITTISLLMNASAQYGQYSRFSIYGVRG
jgi:hypothetical protein